jgi:hypothetical protein
MSARTPEERLAEICRQGVPTIRQVAFPVAIQEVAKCRVLAGSSMPRVVDFAWQMAVEARDSIKLRPITSKRPNEVGNYAEPYLVDAARSLGGSAASPKTRDGATRSAGYPDLEVVAPGGEVFYMEVKTFNPGSEESTFRSFYLSPSDRPKVTRDAVHLLVALGTELIKPQTYSVTSIKLLDLSKLLVDLKIEVQASNADMYGGECVLRTDPA